MKFITVGKIKESWIIQGCSEYEKRLKPFCKLEITILKDKQTIEQEAEVILKHIKDDDFVIVLDERGKEASSKLLAEFIRKKTIDENKKLCFVIGSALGLSEQIKQRANLLLSLSQMTFTHEMARLFLLEQIYRAHMINSNREYHK